MKAKTLNLYSFSYKETKTYLMTTLFVAGNIAFPQLCHSIPNGGLIFLPIYFFTLIAAYKYGLQVGLMTAILSPIINHFLAGMPALESLPAILFKSIFLASLAGFAAKYFKKVSIFILLGVILSYQIIGTLGEWIYKGDFYLAIQDFRIGAFGMLLQVIGGYLVLQAGNKVDSLLEVKRIFKN